MENHKSTESQANTPERPRRKKDMTVEERAKLLQRKLYCKAKQEQAYRFYVLYDKIFVWYILEEAYYRVRASGGSPGIDGQTFEKIETLGLDSFLKTLQEDLRKQTYRPQPVKRVWIPKANGKKRPLGIPTIRDRVAQMACKLIIEPIFEADFEDSSHGFRPKRSAQGAIAAIKQHLQEGKVEVLDADLSSYFDTIPHDKLQKTLETRISDKRVINLINLWLKSPVIEDGKRNKPNGKGTPQGGVISPLLANIYMHLIDRIVNNPKSLFATAGVKIVRYADDFILMGKQITDDVIAKLKELLGKMELTLNEEKTQRLQAKATPFDFLGFTFRYDRDRYRQGRKYWNIVPSKKSENKVRENIRAYLSVSGHYAAPKVAAGLNLILRGWLNYFDIPGVSYAAKSKRMLRHYLMDRLYRYYRRKSQRHSRLHGTQAWDKLVRTCGLIDPTAYRVSKLTAKAGGRSL